MLQVEVIVMCPAKQIRHRRRGDVVGVEIRHRRRGDVVALELSQFLAIEILRFSSLPPRQFFILFTVISVH
jgi:hypothetical protein